MKKYTAGEILQKAEKGKAFTLLILFAGSPVPDDDNIVNQMQLGHLTHLFNMEDEGKCCIRQDLLHASSKLKSLSLLQFFLRTQLWRYQLFYPGNLFSLHLPQLDNAIFPRR